ncbi:haloacid dehalogenase superfamily protein, subfamily IA, variant 3 with third motif having DD or ED [Burkholderiales bacterium JOSHI_001]|nr:haloacid dehalogenase superfamily protein, subfamily IA, variant 3 with third motif having DD or ED [Burkholderiales bacterium JOSHI_001]
MPPGARRVWLFDLDNTLHNATKAAFGHINVGMTDFIVSELGLTQPEADALRRHYWQRYGATLLGLVRHHGVKPAHFLDHAHRLPGLEERVHGHAHDFAALKRLRGAKVILTNAPRDYTRRVLGALGIATWFDAVVSIEDMAMFGHLRPKPDTRMLRRLAVQLRVHPNRCVLVEDTLEHQKAARRVGMGTVWMQRWLLPWPSVAPGRPPRMHRRPAYVDKRVRRLAALCR